MKKILMVFMVLAFIAGGVNAQRDDDSYYIYFKWSDSHPGTTNPGGYVFYDLDLQQLCMTAVRTDRGFNVYAKNGSADAETGAPVVDHSAYPSWYASYGWDVPDADPAFNASAPFYLISLDTFQEKWWFVYSDYPKTKIVDLYVPMGGKTKKVEFNEAGTEVDIEIEDDKGDWACYWVWGFDYVKLQDKKFILHLDLVAKTGWMAPKQIVMPKPPKKPKK